MRYPLAGEEAVGVWLALRNASVARLAEVERAAREYGQLQAAGRDACRLEEGWLEWRLTGKPSVPARVA